MPNDDKHNGAKHGGEGHPHDHAHGHDHHHDGGDHPHGSQYQKLVQLKRAAGKLELEQVRARLSGSTGPRYWRTLEEFARDEGFDELMEREFPRHAEEWTDPVSRRNFMKLMGASMALAGLSACTKQPQEAIVPYVRQPEELVLGKPLFYATAMPLGGIGTPVLVESHTFRPTKVEGNPQHPASGGASDHMAQASILDLYDPDRSQTITEMGEVRPWGAFLGAVRGPLNAQKAIGGAGFRILTGTVTSPALAAQIKAMLQAMPAAKWYQYQPVNRDSSRAGLKAVFGRYVDAHYNFAAADVVVSLDADFLSGPAFPGFLRYSRDFVSRRKLDAGAAQRLAAADLTGAQGSTAGAANAAGTAAGPGMSRVYVMESTPSTTGGKADHRLVARACEIEGLAYSLMSQVGGGGGAAASDAPEATKKWIAAVAKDLMQHRGACVVVPGETQSAAVHGIAATLNAQLGNVGKTVIYTEPVEANPTEQVVGLRELVGEMNAGKVDVLVILGGNPVYDAPADLDFAEAIKKVGLRAHLGLHYNETSDLCQWHIPEAHYLESWGDVRAHDGTVTIIQPLIAPLYDGKSAHEVLAAFSDQPELSAANAVSNYWKTQMKGDFDPQWRRALHDGFVANSALPATGNGASTAGHVWQRPAKPAPGIEIIFRPDPSIYDGRFINNGWLQELPKPLTKLTWDNAALISPELAQRLAVKSEQVVEIEAQGRKLKAPVFVMPGHPDNSITLHLGYGQRKTGRVGAGTGVNAYALRTSDSPHFITGASVRPTGETYLLASTQQHNLIDVRLEGSEAKKRGLVRSATLEEFTREPDFANKEDPPPPKELSLYPEYKYEGYAWGMAIDMNSCVGCNACVAACLAENNIPVVGKTEVARGRAMHWLRIDTYFEGADLANPAIHFQPLPCMQCEAAPCEPVCPVGATVHSTEGLNDMVYNRCVGTRYCSNNCPYKVRRFNFLLYADYETPSLKLMRNPDVTVRSRGVMEKCTYCVQRINSGRITAEKEERRVRDGEIETACQQSCPTDAIIFGDINDPNSRVARLKKGPRNYALLAELNTRPRTTYLAAVRNPNPELEAEESARHGA